MQAQLREDLNEAEQALSEQKKRNPHHIASKSDELCIKIKTTKI